MQTSDISTSAEQYRGSHDFLSQMTEIKATQLQAPEYQNAIFMDIMMPVMNGHEATRKLCALNRSDAATVPIIAMTANAFQDDI